VQQHANPEAEYQTSFLSQYATLTRRNFLLQKDRYMSIVLNVQILFTALVVSLVWFQLPRTEETARDRFGLVSSLRVKAKFQYAS